MAKEHKYHNSRIEIDTALSPKRIVDLAKSVIETQRSVKVVAEDETALLGVVRSILGVKVLQFSLSTQLEGGRTLAATNIEDYITSQQSVFFIPLGPPSMDGHGPYRNFMRAFQQVITAADPSARCVIKEREPA